MTRIQYDHLAASASQEIKNSDNIHTKKENNEELEGLGELSTNQNNSSRSVYLYILKIFFQ